jgi:hypothetical protein
VGDRLRRDQPAVGFALVAEDELATPPFAQDVVMPNVTRRSRGRRPLEWAAAVAIIAGAWVVSPSARDLKPKTLAAFDRYVQLTEARMGREIRGESPFLWLDRHAPAERTSIAGRLARGEVVSARLETRDGSRTIDVEGGLIHHWIGVVLLPGVALDRAERFVQDYGQYPARFTPLIQRARILGRTDDRFEVAMRTWAKKVLTVVLDADYVVDYRRIAPSRLYTKSVATNIFQVDHAGAPGETRTPADATSGLLWRLSTYCWFEERAEGTYEQCESISLTRDVPFGLGWMIKPFITGIPRETLEFTLTHVRQGLGGG